LRKLFLSLFIIFVFTSCGEQNAQNSDIKSKTNEEVINAKITFVELGSVNCIPCKKMLPVMEAIEEKYGNQIKVIFYDVWKDDQKKYATEYGIKLIPTQVFLDEEGIEFFRHEGFFPESEIDKVLNEKGLKILTNVEDKNVK